MGVVFGTYSLTVMPVGQDFSDFNFTTSFSGNSTPEVLEGSFELEGERQFLKCSVRLSSLSIVSRSQESLSELVFDLNTRLGSHTNTNVDGTLKIDNMMKLDCYEYNNTHFVIQYTRLFHGSEEAHYKIEVTFNAAN